MSQNKKLNKEELEKVNGGGWLSNILSKTKSTNETSSTNIVNSNTEQVGTNDTIIDDNFK